MELPPKWEILENAWVPEKKKAELFQKFFGATPDWVPVPEVPEKNHRIGSLGGRGTYTDWVPQERRNI